MRSTPSPRSQLHRRGDDRGAESLVIKRHRHLKWHALDPLEHVLMLVCGISIVGFTSSVFLDVVTRELGRPLLWLQLVTTGFFGWGVFIGMATATRRLDHLNLVEITKHMRGARRTAFEVSNRMVILAVGAAMLVFGIQNFFNDLGSYRAPSLIPLATYTAMRAGRRRADRAVLRRAARERLAQRVRGTGRRGRLCRGSSNDERSDSAHDDRSVSAVRLYGRAGRLRADGRRARGLHR